MFSATSTLDRSVITMLYSPHSPPSQWTPQWPAKPRHTSHQVVGFWFIHWNRLLSARKKPKTPDWCCSFSKAAWSQLWSTPSWWLRLRRQASSDQWASLPPRESTCVPGLQPAATGQLLRFLRQHGRRTIHGDQRVSRSRVRGEQIPRRDGQRSGVQRWRTQRQPGLREWWSSEWLIAFYAVRKTTLGKWVGLLKRPVIDCSFYLWNILDTIKLII